MRLFKALLPLIILTGLGIYARQNYGLLPQSLASAMQYLPILLILMSTIVAIHFNQIRVLSYLIILSSLYFCLDYNWLEGADGMFKFSLFATLAPLVLLSIMLLKQQGVFSIRSLPVYLLFSLFILFALWLIREKPDWSNLYLFMQLLPEQYFDWTQLPQITIAIFSITFIMLIMLLSIRQDNLTSTALGILIILFICLYQNPSEQDLIILICSGLLLCLFTVLQESWRMAYLDELTQLPGRRALRERLQGLVGVYSLAMVDIDFFKKFNDKYGHEIGDDALRMIAAKLQKVTGGGSTYRYGGEEFTIVFGNKTVEQVQEHLEILRESIAQSPFVVNRRTSKTKYKKNQIVKITVSIGVADSIDISTTEETLKNADIALYKAKKKGRNCIVS